MDEAVDAVISKAPSATVVPKYRRIGESTAWSEHCAAKASQIPPYPPIYSGLIESRSLDEKGSGSGRGYNINVPLRAVNGGSAYLKAMNHVVAPALRRFRPELIVVACGIDASVVDPMRRMLPNSLRAAIAMRVRYGSIADPRVGSSSLPESRSS